MAKPITSLSDADTRLAQLNTEILALEKERSALLAAELQNAESRVGEIEAFIGVYRNSPPASAGKAASPAASQPTTTGKRRGRPPGKASAKKAAAQPDPKPQAPTAKAGKAPAQKSPKGKAADRIGAVKELVKKAGKDGVSALSAATELGLPYIAVLNLLNKSAEFKKAGEKSKRRYFLA